MSTLATFTIAGQSDIRQRLNSDGLAALGLAGPLLAPVWTPSLPTADSNALSFQFTASQWFAPVAGMLVGIPDGKLPGLSLLDGTPAANGGGQAAALLIHPQARLRLERLLVIALESAGAAPTDRSLRCVPSTILIRNATTIPANPNNLAAADQTMPAGLVTFHDERGLLIDPFAFAAAIAALLQNTTVLGAPMPSGGPTGTPAAIANLAAAGKFLHVVDLHGRPWSDPGNGKGIGLFTGPANNRTAAGRVADGKLMSWTDSAVLAAEDDAGDTNRPRLPTTVRLGWSTGGTMDTAPLSWPAAGPATPVRDTLRVAAVDLVFHLLGNRTANSRDTVGIADTLTVAEQAPLVRDGSPVTLLADGRASLGWFGQTILAIQGGNPNNPLSTGPLLAATVEFDNEAWPLPTDPSANGRWPASPVATPVPGSVANVMGQLEAMRSTATVQWVQGVNDVVVTLPNTLPNGLFVRLYPLEVLLGTSPDEQPLLVRHDGGSAFVQSGGQIVLSDPFRIGNAPRPAGAKLRADAAATWLPAVGAAPLTLLLGNLEFSVNGEIPAPPLPNPNFLSLGFWKSTASAPIIGAKSRGSFSLAQVFGDPIAFVQQVVRQLSTDQNPREAPRLPTMARTENLLAVQLLNSPADSFRGMLTGGWLTRESDTHTYKSANPGGASNSEVHAPGAAAASQLGFDLWVAAIHRCRPVVPTADIATLPQLPNNWVLLQTSSASNPPNPPASPSSIAGAVLQTVPAFVETPEMALLPDDDVNTVSNWITNQLGNWVGTGNDTELHRQMVREVRTSKYGRRDAQWALRRAIRHARELIYIETPLLAHTAHNGAGEGGPADQNAAVDLMTELVNRLNAEPGLRVVILIPRNLEFPPAFAPWAMHFYAARTTLAQTLQLAGGTIGGRPRVVIAHPMGIPGRPLILRTTTVIVDDVWLMIGTSNLSRRGLTFDGANDMVLVDRELDRGAGKAIRGYRKALMGAHLGVSPALAGQNIAPAQYVQLHQSAAAHAVFADVLANGGEAKLLPLWTGPNPNAPGAVIPHPPQVADPDGRGGASLVVTIAGALAGNGIV